MKKGGFTLIEMVVSVGIISLIILVITGVLMNTFKAKTRVSLADVIEKNGSFALTEIRRNIINSSGGLIVCPVGLGSSLAVTGQDGLPTRIICNEGGVIASSSADVVNLTDDDVRVTGCDGFVSCSLAPSMEVSMVNISFTLASGVEAAGKESYVSKSFEIKVAVRD